MADVDANTDAKSVAREATLLKDAVRQAGSLALSLFRTELRNWIKGASSPVSEADIAVNDLLESKLRSATPDFGWLSEESADDEARLGKPLVWIVDPIDGTRGYLAGRPERAAVLSKTPAFISALPLLDGICHLFCEGFARLGKRKETIECAA